MSTPTPAPPPPQTVTYDLNGPLEVGKEKFEKILGIIQLLFIF
jgi:hypothetical protein